MKQIVFISGCLLLIMMGCKAPKNVFYSANNPYNLKIWMEVDDPIYAINHLFSKNPGKNYNDSANSIHIYVENLSQESMNLSFCKYDIYAFARLANKFQMHESLTIPEETHLEAGQKMVLFSTSLNDFVLARNWAGGNSPFIDKSMKNNSYGDAQVALFIEGNKIISQKKRIYSQIKEVNQSQHQNVELFIYSKAKNYVDKGENNDTLYIDIKNKTKEVISFKMFEQVTLWAASYNQTSMLKLQPTMAYAKQISPIQIAAQEQKTIFKCTLNEILYTIENKETKKFYWQWNTERKHPAISPIVFQDGRLTSGTTLWFEVEMNHKKSSSNILELPVIFSSKKKS